MSRRLCTGVTDKGFSCGLPTGDPTQTRCPMHRGQVNPTQCIAITKEGKQCRMSKLPGKQYCRVHAPVSTTVIPAAAAAARASLSARAATARAKLLAAGTRYNFLKGVIVRARALHAHPQFLLGQLLQTVCEMNGINPRTARAEEVLAKAIELVPLPSVAALEAPKAGVDENMLVAARKLLLLAVDEESDDRSTASSAAASSGTSACGTGAGAALYDDDGESTCSHVEMPTVPSRYGGRK